ncbi:MAG: aldolase [Akkermansiaceae bacterium]|nr:aldolase [Akkermansiaceae bacterium]NNM30615.1 aldolase [Akkermansiaceae bacterium]
MKDFRLKRLFNGRSGRCFDVAIDHGFFNRPGFLEGIEDIRAAIAKVVEAGPDAIQLTVGQARHLQSVPGKGKPALVLRTDAANIYGREVPEVRFNTMIDETAVQAVRLDAACMCVNLFDIPGIPEVYQQCIENIMELKPESDFYAMPMMVEPLAFQTNAEAGGYMVDGNEEKIIHLVRQAVELGADLIKADPTDDPQVYHKVIEAAGDVPVLVRGGGRVDDAEILRRTEEIMGQGAAGIVYGRNVIQHPDPVGITRALMAIVHDGATAGEALKLVGAA